MADGKFSMTLTRRHDYEFAVRFEREGIPELISDESPPLGGGVGPSPTALLGAAVGSCLASSLLFCLQKAHTHVVGLTVDVQGTTARNEDGRLRVRSIDVRLTPEFEGEGANQTARCADIFEKFCTVTGSVREGVDVNVTVEPGGA